MQRDQHWTIHRRMEKQQSQSTGHQHIGRKPHYQSMNQSSNALQNQTPHISTPDNTTTNNDTQITQGSKSTNSTKILSILQFNINSIFKEKAELENVLDKHEIDITTIQETKLKKAHKTPQFNNCTTHWQDRSHNAGGRLITRVIDNII